MPESRSTVYSLLMLGTLAWLGAVVLPGLAESWLGAASHSFFSSICHQMPERSFWLTSGPMAVCTRCFGIYTGFFVGLLMWPYLSGLSRQLLNQPKLLLLFVVPTGIDFFLPNTHWSRFLTGSLAAMPVALFVWVALEEFINLQSRDMTARER